MKKYLCYLFAAITVCTLLLPSPAYAKGNEEYIKQLSFFGDSTTYGMIRYIVENDGRLGQPIVKLTRNQILTPPDGTFYLGNLPTTKIRYQKQVLSLSEAFRKASPEILIVTVGVNGLPSWTEDSFRESYLRLLDVIASATPDTQIVLQSVFPIAKERSAKLKNFSMDKIDRMNGWISTIADEKGLPYLNTASVLKSADGWLNPAYHNGDGMHLNTQGFNKVLAYIIEHPIPKGA